MIVPVILSGGSGTRLWPLSTPQRPKQFLALTGKDTLFQQTLKRVSDRTVYAPPVVVANAAHEDLCIEELAGQTEGCLLLEPIARNTAPAIVMAARLVRELHGSDALLLVMPSDHVIGDAAAFDEAVATGTTAAAGGRLVTFGVHPTAPETGYGYIEAGGELEEAPGAFEVARFTEKPERKVAEAMIADGKHFWNGGIFLYSAQVLLDEAASLSPEISRCCEQAMDQAKRKQGIIYPSAEALESCPNLAVDYAIMERSSRIAMVPLDADWSDVGSWDALAEVDTGERSTPARTIDCSDCFVASDGVEVSMIGVEGLIVVAREGQVVIMRKGESQRIKQLMAVASET